MSDNYELVGSIRSALVKIADNYDEALNPAKVSAGAKVKGSREAPMPLAEHARLARAATFADVRYWCHFILDEVRSVDGELIAERVDGDDFDAMVLFVDRWADRIVTDFPEDAANLAEEMAGHAEALHNIVHPKGRDWMPIGECPVTVADADGNSVQCGHMVRAYDREAADVAWSTEENAPKPKRIQFIQCPGCGTEDTLAWWMSQIVPEGSDRATATQVIAYVAMRGSLILHHDQIRKWASLGHIQRHGKDTKGRTLYSSAAVLAYAEKQTKEEVA